MKGRLIIPVAALTALAIGPAQAQSGGSGQPAGSTVSPAPSAPGFANPGFVNPGIVNPGFVNPNLANQGFVNPNFVNPNFVNPNFANPNFANTFNNSGAFVDPTTGQIIPFGTGFDNGFGTFNNGFNNGFGTFNNGFFDPSLNGFVGNTGFFPGNGGFFPGFGGFPFGGAVNLTPTGWGAPLDPARDLRMAMGTPGRSPMVPVLGINTPAPPLTGRVYAGGRTRVDLTPKTPEDFAARRLAPDQDEVASREGATNPMETESGRIVGTDNRAGPIQQAPATREQVQLAARAERLMEKNPMREGLVIRLNRDTVDVSYECMGENRTEAFPAGEVFFFRTGGALATAATANGALQIGDRVLIACEERPQSRQAVAGSRQEMRGSSPMKSAAASGKSSTGSTGRAKPAPRSYR